MNRRVSSKSKSKFRLEFAFISVTEHVICNSTMYEYGCVTCSLYARLPECNRQLMAYVFCVLHQISLNAAVNKMAADNLAICTALSLLWTKNDVSHDSAKRAIDCVRFLIEQANEVFGLNQVVGLYSEPRFMLKSTSLDTASTDDSLDMSIDDMPSEQESLRHISIDSGAFSDDRSPVLQQGGVAITATMNTAAPPQKTVCTTFVPDRRAVSPSLDEERGNSFDGRHRPGYRNGDERQLNSNSVRLAEKQADNAGSRNRAASANRSATRSGNYSNSTPSSAEILQRNNAHMQQSSKGIVASVYVNNQSKHTLDVPNSNNDNNNNNNNKNNSNNSSSYSMNRGDTTNNYFFFGTSLPLSNTSQQFSDGMPKSPASLKGSYSSDCLNLLPTQTSSLLTTR
jgi:hypothetical protein